jgi:hypothetical protein
VALLSNSVAPVNNAEFELKKKAKISEAQQLSQEVTNAASKIRKSNLSPTQASSSQLAIANSQVIKRPYEFV